MIGELIKIFLDSSNTIFGNDHDFREPYAFYKDTIFPGVNEYELFRCLYNNRFENIIFCNPWMKNLEKILFLKVFVDVDLVKALIKSYNP